MSSIGSAELSKTDFLTLLTTQLRYQDPTSPVDQEAFVNQLSQFSMMEGIQSLNGSFTQLLHLQEVSQGVNLVGKNVQYLDDATGGTSEGRVDRVAVSNGSIFAEIGSRRIPMENITSVSV